MPQKMTRSPSDQELANWKRFHELFSWGFIHEALGTAAELEIADALGDRPASAGDLANALHLDAPALYRLLRALVAYGIFEEVDGQFYHNSFSRQLRKDHPYTFQGMARLWHCEPMRKAWGSFASAIRDGRSAFFHGNGAAIYDFLENDSETAELFHRGMENNSAVVADALARGFPFGEHASVIDLGGGVGALLAAILHRHPISGAVYDLPGVSVAADTFLRESGLNGRAQFIPGDWFESVPEGFDIYLVKNSLWNWPDAHCAKILANIGRAMSRNAKLLIIEYLTQPRTAAWSTAFDLQQLNVTGGRGRTEQEYGQLLDGAGLAVAAVNLVQNQNILQCRKVAA